MIGRLATLAPALAAAAAWGCSDRGDSPRLEAVEPSAVFADEQALLTLRGAFWPRVRANLDAPSESVVDPLVVELFLADALRALGPAAFVDQETLTVALPAGTPPGSWGVRVRDAWGREAALEGALTVRDRPPWCCDDAGVPLRTPPRVEIVTAATLVREGAAVQFDSSRTLDRDTPPEDLEVSWLFSQGAGWTDWSADPLATAAAPGPGEWTVVARVRDEDGDVGYGEVRLFVAAAPAPICRVTTGSDVHDGATGCDAPGPDGVLSLDEAVAVVSALTPPGNILIAQGLNLEGASLAVAAAETRIGVERGVRLRRELVVPSGAILRLSGVEVVKPPGPGRLRVAGGALDLSDTRLQGQTPLRVTSGDATVRRCFFDCSTCVAVDGTNARLWVEHSRFVGDLSGVAIDVPACGGGGGGSPFGIYLLANAFSRFGTGVRIGASCGAPTSLLHQTFDANGTGVSYAAGATQVQLLMNSVFSRHAASAIAGCDAAFTFRGGNLIHQNASDACLAEDPDVLRADPLFVDPDAPSNADTDLRLSYGSPAIDAASTLVDVNGAAPGRSHGEGADIGGRETY